MPVLELEPETLVTDYPWPESLSGPVKAACAELGLRDVGALRRAFYGDGRVQLDRFLRLGVTQIGELADVLNTVASERAISPSGRSKQARSTGEHAPVEPAGADDDDPTHHVPAPPVMPGPVPESEPWRTARLQQNKVLDALSRGLDRRAVADFAGADLMRISVWRAQNQTFKELSDPYWKALPRANARQATAPKPKTRNPKPKKHAGETPALRAAPASSSATIKACFDVLYGANDEPQPAA